MTAPNILTAPELMALVLPEPRWAVPGVVPEGLSIFSGRPKQGKSWLMMATAIAVASGGKALGRLEVQVGDVLYLALEDSAKRLQQRLDQLLDGAEPPEHLHIAREWPRGDIAQLEVWLQAHPDRRLVVIDTLGRFRPRPKGDRGYAEDYDDLEPLQKLAVKYQVAIVVIHHHRKLAADDWIDTITGTLGLAAAADCLLGLFRVRGESQAVLKVTGRDVEDQELGLSFDPSRGTWALLGSAETTVMLTTERQAVLTAMSRLMSSMSGLVNARELAVHIRKSYPATVKLLQRMQAEGLVSGSRGKDAGWRVVHQVSGMSGMPIRTYKTDRTEETYKTDRTSLYKEDEEAGLEDLDRRLGVRGS
jgi:hypothetical protein